MSELYGFLKETQDILRPHHAAIIGQLKLEGELPIKILARKLRMSYTGVQPHCDRMIELGFLQRRRQIPENSGRPVLAYSLTPKADIFFPTEASRTLLSLLDQAALMFGSTTPERLLMMHFQAQQKAMEKSVLKGKSIVEKATRLVAERLKLGHLAICGYQSQHGFHITEFHHPLLPLFERYPSASRMDIQCMETLIGSKITPLHQGQITTYQLGTLGRG